MHCLVCRKEIPINHVQQGNMHLNCAEQELPVLKFWPKVQGNPVVVEFADSGSFISAIIESGVTETWCAEMVIITQLEFRSLKEHQGW